MTEACQSHDSARRAEHPSKVFVGVDGCAAGWVAVVISDSGFVEARVFKAFAELMGEFAGAKVIAVDMPIGLVDKGDREADQAARNFLTGQASSVFNSPPRPVLAAKDYNEAQAISKQVNGKGLSKQSYNLLAKIVQVDAFAADARVYEVHPEVSLRLMNGGAALQFRKKSWGGMHVRLQLLERVGITLPADLGEVNAVGTDDVVDAAVAAWSGRRIAAGEARSFPEAGEQRDVSGRRIAIWG